MERFKAAKCSIHGADRFKGCGCEVFNERQRSIGLKKRQAKRVRQWSRTLIEMAFREADPVGG